MLYEVITYGITSKPLTEDLCEALWMLYLEGFHVRTYHQPEEVQGLTESDLGFGSICSESSLKQNRLLPSSKIVHSSLSEDLTKFSGILPRWGSMQSGELYQRQISADIMNARESGSKHVIWPTPQASDNRDRGNLSSPAIQRRIQNGKQVMLSMCVSDKNGRLNPNWVEWLMSYNFV